MKREQQVGSLAHADPATEVDAPLSQRLVFLEELEHVENHAVAQETALAGMNNPRWDLVEDELLLAHVDGVSSVRAALVTGDQVHVLCKHVDNLSLALVAPLTADDDRALAGGHTAPTPHRKQRRPAPAGGRTSLLYPLGKLDRSHGSVNAPIKAPCV